MSHKTISVTVKCELKSRAKTLKNHFKNLELQLGDVHEALAQYYGFKDWNTASAKLKDIPYNPAIYLPEDFDRLYGIIIKILDRRRKKFRVFHKKNHGYATIIKIIDNYKFHKVDNLKILERDLNPVSIQWGDFCKINFKISDEFKLKVNKFLEN